MTFPSADKEEFINFAYFNRRSLNYYKDYVEFVFLTL